MARTRQAALTAGSQTCHSLKVKESNDSPPTLTGRVSGSPGRLEIQPLAVRVRGWPPSVWSDIPYWCSWLELANTTDCSSVQLSVLSVQGWGTRTRKYHRICNSPIYSQFPIFSFSNYHLDAMDIFLRMRKRMECHRQYKFRRISCDLLFNWFLSRYNIEAGLKSLMSFFSNSKQIFSTSYIV